MRAIREIIPAATAGNRPVQDAPKPAGIDSATAAVVNRLFAELQSIFPAWRQAWPDKPALDAAKRTWVKAFMAAKLSTLEQIRYGIERCRLSGSDFAPSAGKFIEWCRPTPEALGLPEPAKAYRQACALAHPAADRTGVHRAVYHAACEAGFYELAHLPEAKSRALFERAYERTVQMLLAGEPLREIPKALPAQATAQRTEQVARDALDNLKRALRGAA